MIVFGFCLFGGVILHPQFCLLFVVTYILLEKIWQIKDDCVKKRWKKKKREFYVVLY